MSATETRQVGDFPLFDWLRIAMAALVAIAHFNVLNWSHAGNLGVQVFFALSGWLIGTILIEMRGDHLPLFYFNRATRVWIPYFVAVLLLYAVSTLRDPITWRWLEFLFYDVTFTHNFFTLRPDFNTAVAQMPLKGTGNHFWSLAVEEQFYLTAPLLILFAPGGRHPLTWLAIGAAALFVREEFSAIAFGVAAAAMHHRRPGFQRGIGPRSFLALVTLGTGIGLFTSRYEYVVPFFAIAVVLLLAEPGRRGTIGRFVGGISYPFYLNHWIALIATSMAIKRFGGNVIAWTCLGMAMAFAVAAIAYLLVDRPVLARRKQWYTPGRGRALAITAYCLVGTGLAVGITLHGV